MAEVERPIRSLGYRTDRMMVRAWGGSVVDHGRYRVFTTPRAPDHFNGNFVLFDGPPDERSPEEWPAVFTREVPPTERGYLVQLGWDEPHARAEQAQAFVALGYGRASWEVLVADCLDAPRVPAGLDLRPVADDAAWAALIALILLDYEGETRVRLEGYFHRMAAAYRHLVESGVGVCLGAYDGDRLAGVASAFTGDGLARYQWIMTDPAYRRRGICQALLREAGAWCTARGAGKLVIVATQNDPAAATYRAAGFQPAESVVRLAKRLTPA